ncbi:MAG: adenylate/guanylate cyclase domain-containing protein [Cyclobacteriaceae bacterium]
MSSLVTTKFKRNASRILPFGLIWLGTSWVFLLSDMTLSRNQNLNPDTDITLTIPVIIFASIMVVIVGLLVGTIEMIVLEKHFRNYKLIEKIAYKLLFYLLFMLLLISFTYPVAASIEQNTSITNKEVWLKMGRFLGSLTFLNTMIQLAFSLLLSLVYSAISENLGHNVLRNIFFGKYHNPKIERRIFMFLDMKNSTTIAEEMGHVEYFKLLRAYYEIMSDPIINSKGEVYQYIGDEVVVTWNEEAGFYRNNCINCFHEIKNNLNNQSEFFLNEFGVIPDFKAGIHVGEVTTGEIGALKKEIVFTGDVLNTTSRIQSLCKDHQSDLIISDTLLSGLKISNEIKISELGEFSLKGKSHPMTLHAVEFQLSG